MRGEYGDRLTSRIQMAWYYVVNQKDLRVMTRRFVEECKRRGSKMNADNSKVILLVKEKESVCVRSV